MTQTYRGNLEQALDEFFAAAEIGDFERAGAVVTDDAVLWQNADGIERRFAEALPRLGRMYAKLGPWRYGDVRRVVGDDAICEQHTVTFSRLGGPDVTADVCVVIRFGEDGRITRLEEYLDSAAVASLGRSQEANR
jgi:ketosteroid isomerase-like protein